MPFRKKCCRASCCKKPMYEKGNREENRWSNPSFTSKSIEYRGEIGGNTNSDGSPAGPDGGGFVKAVASKLRG